MTAIVIGAIVLAVIVVVIAVIAARHRREQVTLEAPLLGQRPARHAASARLAHGVVAASRRGYRGAGFRR